MSRTTIRVENLSKRYRLGLINRRMLVEELQERWSRWIGRSAAPLASDVLWAVRDVSFEVKEGDVVGIIGHNGSGKSTLLKILSQITAPTSGRALIKGRIASLLEVGTGFHPELTGRDNVFLNGVILGMKREEVARKFDEIVAFSGIEDFIDTPVKRYSSGMRVRLAFAVAAHLDPDILVIDEVLAVGDQSFQQKCLGKMGEVARTGRTILFVSHNAAAVESLCNRGIVMDHGRLKFDGGAGEALTYYMETQAPTDGSLRSRTDRTGSGELQVVDIEFRNREGTAVSTIAAGQDLDICLHFENPERFQEPRLNARLNITNHFGLPVFTQSNWLVNQPFAELPERGTFVCRIPRLPLPVGAYWIEYQITKAYRQGDPVDILRNAAELHVDSGDFFGSGTIPAQASGMCLVPASWSVEERAAAPAVATVGS